ncbi:Tetratricopeptide repeat protein 38 [Heracleum sosnowskyi]|uniref:Tetratricopeptide repeat protein 38 n=1 Tax=Heracleum sosnowskyi TaxID=360622 RepID=A0AAD8GMF7_9APIA|nr:Tetratricopeptide repeat protein 38 [Heracleum sosnowskyi]KAK1362131.1 Tetratricopeptide repeat protein 38 [Heracleum sosnowskyi]
MTEHKQVKLDRWGYEINTISDSCISSINAYYHQVLSYGRSRSVIVEASQQDPSCVLANILTAHYYASSSNPSLSSAHLEAAKAHLDHATSYEKAVFDALTYLMTPDRDDDVAVNLHSKLLKDFPKDMVSLKRAQVLCFYMGRPDLSLELVEQVLPVNEQENYIYGMLAFPLLELGRMADAEKAARKGLEINKEDPWVHHAICHVLQFECRFKEAVEFMKDHSQSWNALSSFMITHNWWHVALCYLEGQSSIEKVLEVYDCFIWKELERCDATAAEVYLNALGLLLRVYLRGRISEFSDSLKILAERLTDKQFWHLEWHLDLLILWALACTGKQSDAENLFEGLKCRMSGMTKKKQQIMQRGIELAEAMYRYGKGDSELALELLGSEFNASNYKMIGASEEQLDVFNEMWYIMLLNTGRAKEAISVIELQLQKREAAPFLWYFLEKAYSELGRSKEAADAGAKGRALELACAFDQEKAYSELGMSQKAIADEYRAKYRDYKF